MGIPNSEPMAIATPEWATAYRTDRELDARVNGGWVATPAPLSRGACFTDFSTKVMAVPEGDSPMAVGVRVHELHHARFSPSHVPGQLAAQIGIDPSMIRVAEEFRINRLATSIPTNWVAGRHRTDADIAERLEMVKAVKSVTDGSEKASADNAVANNDWRSAVFAMFSTYGLDSYNIVKRRLRMNADWKGAVSGVDKHLKKMYSLKSNHTVRHPFWNSTDPVEFRYKDGFTTESVMLPYGFVNGTLEIASLINQIVRDGGIGESAMNPDLVPFESDEDPGDEPSLERPARVGSNAKWLPMRIGMTNLTEATASFVGRRKRPSMTGKFPSRPDRLLTDPERRIFREVVRGQGGVVVFDCSGSMGVRHAYVREVVQEFSGALVLAYTHSSFNSASAWVLAKDGRMVSESEMNSLNLNNGNGVDGLALRWAIQNRRTPKDFIVWVSDCGVTGVGDSFSHDLLADCAELVRKHGIIQVDDCDNAMELVRKMKRDRVVPRRHIEDENLRATVVAIEQGHRPVPMIGIATSSRG